MYQLPNPMLVLLISTSKIAPVIHTRLHNQYKQTNKNAHSYDSVQGRHLWPRLLTWSNFNPSEDK